MKIAICTPAYDGRAHINYNRSVREALTFLQKHGHEAVVLDAQHCANLPRLRNALVASAFEWGADVLVWVDSDIAFDPGQLLALCNTGLPVVGIPCQKRPRDWRTYKPEVAFKALENGGVGIVNEDIVEVRAVPTAFMVTRMDVYRKMAELDLAKPLANREGSPMGLLYRNYFWYELEPVEGPNGETLYFDDGEDYYFCKKAREAGFKVYLYTKGRVVHHEGRQRLDVNFWDLHGHVVTKAIEDDGDEQHAG